MGSGEGIVGSPPSVTLSKHSLQHETLMLFVAGKQPELIIINNVSLQIGCLYFTSGSLPLYLK